MTDLNEFLATEVMGWRHRRVTPTDGIDEYRTPGPNSKYIMAVEDWNPRENIAQAMMCLEQFPDVTIRSWNMTGGGRMHRVKTDFNRTGWMEGGAESQSLPKAVSLACARARGWKDE